MVETKIYGAGDDNICTDGEYSAEHGCYSRAEKGILLVVSDGTLLEVKYGKTGLAIWSITVIKKGTLFNRIEPCDAEDAEIYSDIVYMKEGVKFIYACDKYNKME